MNAAKQRYTTLATSLFDTCTHVYVQIQFWETEYRSQTLAEPYTTQLTEAQDGRTDDAKGNPHTGKPIGAALEWMATRETLPIPSPMASKWNQIATLFQPQ
jgi:hypothetical protein